MIKLVKSLTLYPIDAPMAQMPVLRVGVSQTDDTADIVMSESNPSASDLNELSKLARDNFFRAAYVSYDLKNGKIEIEAAIRAAGAKTTWSDRLPTSHAMLWRGGLVRRGGMTSAVRSICASLSKDRTLWRSIGQASILECPNGSEPWLRPIEISEVEMMVDALGVEADDTQGESGYIMNRVVYAVAAYLPSWLPPAGSVERTEPGRPAGYDRATETIRLPFGSK